MLCITTMDNFIHNLRHWYKIGTEGPTNCRYTLSQALLLFKITTYFSLLTCVLYTTFTMLNPNANHGLLNNTTKLAACFSKSSR